MFRRLRGTFIPGLISLLCFGQSNHGQPVPSPTPATAGNIVSLSPQTASSGQSAGTSVSDSSVALSSMPNLLGEAIALYRKGDFDGALAKYQAVLQQKPKSPDAWAGIIRVYLKQKKVDQASYTADQALALSDAPRVRAAHAEVLFRQGKIDLAEKEWVAVVNSGYPEARAYLGIARVYRAAAMYKSAERMIKKAHELDSTDPDIQEQIGRAHV